MENTMTNQNTKELIIIHKNSNNNWLKNLSDCTKIFEIVGLQFFTPKYVSSENLSKSPSILRKIYAIFLLITFSGLVTFVIIANKKKTSMINIDINNLVVVAVRRAAYNLLFFIIVISITQSYMCTTFFKKVYLNLEEIVEMAKRNFNHDVNFLNFTKTCRIRLIVFPLTLACFHFCFVLVKVFVTQKGDLGKINLEIVFYFFPLLFMALLSMRTVFYVRMTNQLLLELLTIFTKTFKLSKHPLEMDKTRKMEINARVAFSDVSSKLLAMRQIYNLIFDISNKLNKSWGLTLFCYLTGFIISMIVTEYEFFLLFVDEFNLQTLLNSLYSVTVYLVLCGPIFLHCHRMKTLVRILNREF